MSTWQETGSPGPKSGAGVRGVESPHIFIGSLASLEEKFIRRPEQLGINSTMVGELGPFDALVERLAGT